LLIAGQMYCAAKTLHASKPKATVMTEITGIGMVAPSFA
jgi:hypothetical protein